MLQRFLTGITIFVSVNTYAQTCESLFLNMAPQIIYKGSTAIISEYIVTELPRDLKDATELGEKLVGRKLDFNDLKITVGDSEQKSGVADPFQNALSVWTDIAVPRKFKVSTFQGTFFHEFGHLVFYRYLIVKKSKLYREFTQNRPTYNEVDHKELAEKQAVHWNMKYLMLPYLEFMADLFQVIYLQSPGGPFLPRNFHRMSAEVGQELAKGEGHNIFNPLRRMLWQKFLRPNIDNPDALILIYQAVAKAVLEEIDLQDPYRKYDPDVKVMNKQLLNRVKAELKER